METVMELSGRNHSDSDSDSNHSDSDSETYMECNPCLCDDETGMECAPCLYDNKTVAGERFCTDCNEFMCNNCARLHRKFKATRNHDTIDADEMRRGKLTTVQEKFCSEHANEKNIFFCEKHAQLCCSVCVILGHMQCGVSYLDRISKGFKASQEYQDLLKQIHVLETKLLNTKKQSEKNCKAVRQCFTTLISDIQHFRSQINTKLDELEIKVTEEAKKIKTEDLKSMESIATEIECIQNRLKEISSTLESLEKYEQNHQLFITGKRSFKEVMDFNKQTDRISVENKFRNYSFSWNEEIFQSLESFGELVHLNVKETEKRHLLVEKQSQGEGNIMYKDPKEIKAKFVKNINIRHKQDSSRYIYITGIDLLTCDTLALTDLENYAVKLLDLHTDTITSCLQLVDKPIDLTCMDSNTLVVTCDTNLTFLKFDEKLSIMQQIPTEDGCHGITSHQNKLFVTFTGKPSVKIIDGRGAVLHTIQTDSQGQNLFVKPEYITMSTDGQTIYVSDSEQNTVTRYSVTDEQLNVYKHEDLDGTVGLTVIEDKFTCVCGLGSVNLHAISSLCEHIQIVLDSKNVEGWPCTVLYNRANSMIYIGYGGNSLVSVFKLEWRKTQTEPSEPTQLATKTANNTSKIWF